MDDFAILGVDRNASPADIKKAYRNLARANFPDHATDKAKATETLQAINAAYDRIKSGKPHVEKSRREGKATNDDTRDTPFKSRTSNATGQGSRPGGQRGARGPGAGRDGPGAQDFTETFTGRSTRGSSGFTDFYGNRSSSADPDKATTSGAGRSRSGGPRYTRFDTEPGTRSDAPGSDPANSRRNERHESAKRIEPGRDDRARMKSLLDGQMRKDATMAYMSRNAGTYCDPRNPPSPEARTSYHIADRATLANGRLHIDVSDKTRNDRNIVAVHGISQESSGAIKSSHRFEMFEVRTDRNGNQSFRNIRFPEGDRSTNVTIAFGSETTRSAGHAKGGRSKETAER